MKRFGPKSKAFVTIKSHNEVKVVDQDDELHMTLRELQNWIRSKEFSSVYAHFLSNSMAYVLFKTQLTKLPCHWIMWGADFYGLPSISDRYYLPLSRPFAWKNNTLKHKLIRFLGLPSSKYVIKVMKDIDFFVGYEEEFKLTQMILGHKMKLKPWEYYFSIKEMNLPKVNQGTGAILLGNSDDPMNNHLDTLKKLEEVVSDGQRIIIPVAGAPDLYLQKLKEVQASSKAQVVLQEKLLDSKEFFGMLDEVSFVVFGHLRQQGVGTLLPLIYQGKKAFLWNTNPFKSVLERWGVEINAIDDLVKADLIKLSDQEVVSNRSSMDRVLSVEADAERWEKILSEE